LLALPAQTSVSATFDAEYAKQKEAGANENDAHQIALFAVYLAGIARGRGEALPERGSDAPHDTETLGDFWRGDVKATDAERRWIRQALAVLDREAAEIAPRNSGNAVGGVGGEEP